MNKTASIKVGNCSTGVDMCRYILYVYDIYYIRYYDVYDK